jgi:hypothetical protein
VLGVELESPALIGLDVLLSLLLAAAVMRTPATAVLGAVTAFSAGFALLDILEATNQAGEHTGPLLVASLLALGHTAAVALSARLLAARC